VELTDDIKKQIMEKTYHNTPVPAAPTSTSIVVNNITNIVAFLSNMDPFDKYTKFINYKKLEQKGLEELVDETFSRTAARLEKREIDLGLSRNDFLEMVDKISVCKNIEDFNIAFDQESSKIKVYHDGVWEEYLVESGLNYILHVIKDYYIDPYEKYLLTNIEICKSLFKKQCYQEHLRECYKFLCCFDI
jgi:hypothetical protein